MDFDSLIASEVKTNPCITYDTKVGIDENTTPVLIQSTEKNPRLLKIERSIQYKFSLSFTFLSLSILRCFRFGINKQGQT